MLKWSELSERERDARGRAITECTRCGKEFSTLRKYLRMGKMKYCSRLCSQLASRRVEAVEFDGKRYVLHPQNGYYISSDGKNHKLHRVVWEKYNGAIPDGFIIHHKNENKIDNSIENLELMTPSEHTAHHSKDRHMRGLQPRKPRTPCIRPECDRLSQARGLCTKHYQRLMAYCREKAK